ncbi:MAG: hypothetical protein HC822_20670 [Oscillochloris sp.]|nr:hypothetical protein [Oscillochloris sp.]
MNNELRIAQGRWVDPENDDMPARRERKPARKAPVAPLRKQSYEGNQDVQRWLQEQAINDGRKPPFAPTFLAGRRDADWISSSLAHFYEHDLIVDVLQEVKSGKEATVFCCSADPGTGAELLAAKVYRPRMFRSLSNDAIYRDGRTLRDEQGNVVRGNRRRVPGTNSARGRALQVESWIGFEYTTHELIYAAGVTTPRPYAYVGNGVLMAYLGDLEDPAPRLSDIEPEPAEAKAFLSALIDDIRRSLSVHRIHGDLSAYNVLIWAGRPWLIDFAQAVDPRQSEDAKALLTRDVRRVIQYLRRFGASADADTLSERIWDEYVRI